MRGQGQERPLGKVALEEEPTRGEVNKHANKRGKNVLEETAVQSPGWGKPGQPGTRGDRVTVVGDRRVGARRHRERKWWCS